MKWYFIVKTNTKERCIRNCIKTFIVSGEKSILLNELVKLDGIR